MAQLTWRNIDAPDFRTSLEGYRTFSSLLNNAFSGLSAGLDQFDQSRSDRVNNAVRLQLAQAQDAEAAREIMANLGPDSKRLNVDTINAFQARPEQLLRQAALVQSNEQNKYSHNRLVNENALDDAARVGFAKYQEDRSNGKPGVITDAMRQSGLFTKALESGSDLATQDLSRRSTSQNMQQSAAKFGWEAQDRQFADEAARIAEAVIEHSGNGEDAQFALSRVPGSARAKQMARDILVGQGAGNAFAPTGGFATGTNADPTRVMNYEARASGFSSVPDTVKTMGQASDFALQVNAANKARTGSPGSSAMGTYQIVGETMRSYAPKVLGKDWQNQPFNQENQDKIAEAIFNDNKGSAAALSKQWVSLSPREAELVRRMPWSQAREVIAAKESNASPASLITPVQANTAATILKQSTENAQGVGSRVLSLAQDNIQLPEAIKKAQDGNFKGVDPSIIQEKLRWVMQTAGVNAATALDVINNARVVPQRDTSVFGGLFNLGRKTTTSLGNGWELDDNAIRRDIVSLRERVDTKGNKVPSKAITAAMGAQNDANRLQVIQTAQNELAAAQQALVQARAQAQIRPGAAAQLPRYEQRVAMAQAKLQAAQR